MMQSTGSEGMESASLQFRGVKALVDEGLHGLPEIFIRPEDQRPGASTVNYTTEIPVIDLQNSQGRLSDGVIGAIGRACEEWGCFQVVNHGIDLAVMNRMMESAGDFFALPAEEKMKYSGEFAHSSPVRYASSFNLKEDKILNWRDFLRFSCHPLDDVTPLWPTNPPAFIEATASFSRQMHRLTILQLAGAVTRSLGLPVDYIQKNFKDYSHFMVCNYYPRCPNPEYTLGVGRHTDPGWLTVLMQDGVAGLQVFNRGRWFVVNPIPGALVVNLGDMLQILSNGRYKSVEHRAVVNGNRDRVTVITTYGPSYDSVISPAQELVENVAMYKACVYGDYMRTILNGSLDGKSSIDHHALLVGLAK